MPSAARAPRPPRATSVRVCIFCVVVIVTVIGIGVGIVFGALT